MTPSAGRTPPPARGGLRARKKAETRRNIQDHALRLFLEQGYDGTTVEEIATAAGVSHMTFFRYFPTKEAVVESDDYDPMITELIAARPSAEDALTALRRALGQGLTSIYEADREALLVRTRLILETPALRARQWQNQHATERLFTETLAARGPAEDLLRIRVLAAASLAALTTALTAWVESEGGEHLPTLVDAAFEVLRTPVTGVP